MVLPVANSLIKDIKFLLDTKKGKIQINYVYVLK